MTLWTSILAFFGCNSNNNTSKSNTENGKVEMMNPNDILMSISTIESTLPGTNEQPKDSLDLEILEDDWRQFEFINTKYKNSIDKEIDSINMIIENESVDLGENMTAFKNLHVRKLIPNPLDEGIAIEDLKNAFSSFQTGSLSFDQYGRVINGIYFDISGFHLYGLTNNSKVTALGFYGLSSWENLETFKNEMKAFMDKYNVVLVNWRSMMVIDSNGIDDYLKPNE